MRSSRSFASIIFLAIEFVLAIGLLSILTPIVSAEIKIKVVDPQDAVLGSRGHFQSCLLSDQTVSHERPGSHRGVVAARDCMADARIDAPEPDRGR